VIGQAALATSTVQNLGSVPLVADHRRPSRREAAGSSPSRIRPYAVGYSVDDDSPARQQSASGRLETAHAARARGG